jgi:hypothetical protein
MIALLFSIWLTCFILGLMLFIVRHNPPKPDDSIPALLSAGGVYERMDDGCLLKIAELPAGIYNQVMVHADGSRTVHYPMGDVRNYTQFGQ